MTHPQHDPFWVGVPLSPRGVLNPARAPKGTPSLPGAVGGYGGEDPTVLWPALTQELARSFPGAYTSPGHW